MGISQGACRTHLVGVIRGGEEQRLPQLIVALGVILVLGNRI